MSPRKFQVLILLIASGIVFISFRTLRSMKRMTVFRIPKDTENGLTSKRT